MTTFAHLPNMHLLTTARLFENGIVAGYVPAYVVSPFWPQLVSLNLQSGVLPLYGILWQDQYATISCHMEYHANNTPDCKLK